VQRVEQKTEPLRFQNDDGDTLVGRLHRPLIAAPVGTAIFAHCFACSKNSIAAARICRALAEHGWQVLRFDFTGLGDSEGSFARTSFASNVRDIVAASNHLTALDGTPPALFIGHSLGGTAVLAAAHKLPDAVAFATIGSPFLPRHVEKLILSRAPDLPTKGRAKISLGGAPFYISSEFLDALRGHGQADRVRELGRPLMIFHSPADAVVSIDNATAIFKTAQHPRSFVSLDQANHMLTDAADAQMVGEMLCAWAGRLVHSANAHIDAHFE